jgi:hypothetical protein
MQTDPAPSYLRQYFYGPRRAKTPFCPYPFVFIVRRRNSQHSFTRALQNCFRLYHSLLHLDRLFGLCIIQLPPCILNSILVIIDGGDEVSYALPLSIQKCHSSSHAQPFSYPSSMLAKEFLDFLLLFTPAF